MLSGVSTLELAEFTGAYPQQPMPVVVSNSSMRFRWRVILPLSGLLLFGMGTYASLPLNHPFLSGTGRYFWWSALRLDSDPLNRHSSSRVAIACPDNPENCLSLDPIAIWIDPGWLSKCFVISSLPAFLATLGIVRGLGRLGSSVVTSFFVSMPLLTLGWFYFVGWVFDRWHRKGART
jgi:hypothetical protein